MNSIFALVAGMITLMTCRSSANASTVSTHGAWISMRFLPGIEQARHANSAIWSLHLVCCVCPKEQENGAHDKHSLKACREERKHWLCAFSARSARTGDKA